MINTYLDKPVEPRAGDKLIGPLGVVKEVRYLLNNNGIMFTDGTFAGNGEDYTLLHRPFQVGDEQVRIEFSPIQDQVEADMANQGKFTYQRLHKNPAWRDHPDYKEG